MKNYEITVRPLSEEAKASGFETLVREVDAFILGTVVDNGGGTFSTLGIAQGPDIVWFAFFKLVEGLSKQCPEKISVVLPAVMASVLSGDSDKKRH